MAEEKYNNQLVILHIDQEESINLVQEFANQYDISSPFLMDSNAEVGRLYQLRGTPTTFFIDSEGVIQDFQIGYVKLDWIDNNFNSSS